MVEISKPIISLVMKYFFKYRDISDTSQSTLPKLPARRRYHRVDLAPGDEPLPPGQLQSVDCSATSIDYFIGIIFSSP